MGHEYTGLSPEESFGWGWRAAVHGEDVVRLLDRWATRDAEGGRECEARLRRSDGDFQWFSLRHEPVCDPTGAVVRWYGTWINIEDSKQKELLGLAGQRALEMIADGAGLSEILNELCSVIDVYATATSQVLLMDRTGHQLLPLAGPNFPPAVTAALAPWPVGPNKGCCGTAAFTGERVVISDISADPRWLRTIDGEAGEGSCGLRVAGGLVGTSDFERWEKFLARSASLIRNPDSNEMGSRINRGVRTDCANRDRVSVARSSHYGLRGIKNSETNLRRVIDTIPTLAWCNTPDGPNEFLNKRWHEYTGSSHEDSTGWGWQAAFHPEDVPPMMKKWRELLASGESGEIEARLRRHDGVYRWFLIRVEPFRDERGQLLRWYGTSTDIEALKQTQEKLREDEQELRRITDAIPQAIVVLDPSGTPLYANQATLGYAGLTPEDVLAPGFRKRLFLSDDLERFRDERKAALGRGVPFEVELRARRKDGAYRWFLIRYNPFRNEQGQLTRWYATGTDIDDRVRAEERTRNENLALREQIDRDSMFEDIVGSSDALRKVLSESPRWHLPTRPLLFSVKPVLEKS